MRIANFFSPFPPGRSAYVRGLRQPASTMRLAAAAALLLLAAQSATASPATTRRFSRTETPSGEYSPSKKKYDCTSVDGKKIPTFDDDALEEGIDEAKKLLRNCPACRQFYGDIDPIKRLEELKNMGAIIVSEISPGRRGSNEPWPFIEFPPIPSNAVAAVSYLNPRKVVDPKDSQPCMYVNRHNFLGSDTHHIPPPYDGLPLPRARGVAVLHELAHIMDVIPSDGVYREMLGKKKVRDSKASEERSIQNTWCIRNNCTPCAAQCSCCPGKSSCKSSRKRCPPPPPLAPARRGSIIEEFRRLSNQGLALVS